MSTTTAQATTSSTTYFPKRDGYDIEPDEQWKAELKQRIEEGLLSMVKDAKRSLEQQLLQPGISDVDRERYKAEYTQAMKDIRNLATESYHAELDRERTERRWAAGIPIPQGWSRALAEEQREIMETIKRTAGQEGGASASPSSSPIEERRHTSTASRAAAERAAPPALTPAPETSSRERTYDQSTKVHHASDNIPPPPRERDEATPSVGRSTRKTSGGRAPLPQSWAPPPPAAKEEEEERDIDTEDEPIIKREPRSKRSMDMRSIPETATPPVRPAEHPSRSGSISERNSARSPPKPLPAFWKPTVTPEEDAAASRPSVAPVRRNSTASIQSNGSAGRRPSIVETIPERTETTPDLSNKLAREKEQRHEAERQWSGYDKVREREKQTNRNDDRQKMYSEDIRPLEGHIDSPVKSPASPHPPSSPYQTASPRRVSSKASLTSDSHRSSTERRASSRTVQVTDVPDDDLPPHRPGFQKASYDRAHEFRNPASQPHVRPPSVPIIEERTHQSGILENPYRRLSSKSSRSFAEENESYDGRHGGRYTAPHHASPLSPNRPPERYSTPASATMRSRRELTPEDEYDEEAVYNDYPTYGPRPPPEEMSDYTTPGGTRPMPSRQTSYKREEERRRNDDDGHSHLLYSVPASNPISVPRQSPVVVDDSAMGSWKEWTDGRRPSESRYDYPRMNSNQYHPPMWVPSSYGGDRVDSPAHRAFAGKNRHLQTDSDIEAYDSEQEREDLALKRLQAELKKKNLEAQKKEMEVRKKEMEAKLREAEARTKAAEAQLREQQAKEKEDEIKRLAEEARQKEEEAKRIEEEARRKEEEIRRKEEEARRKEEETRRKEEEIRRKEEDLRRREADLARREYEAKQREAYRKEELEKMAGASPEASPTDLPDAAHFEELLPSEAEEGVRVWEASKVNTEAVGSKSSNKRRAKQERDRAKAERVRSEEEEHRKKKIAAEEEKARLKEKEEERLRLEEEENERLRQKEQEEEEEMERLRQQEEEKEKERLRLQEEEKERLRKEEIERKQQREAEERKKSEESWARLAVQRERQERERQEKEAREERFRREQMSALEQERKRAQEERSKAERKRQDSFDPETAWSAAINSSNVNSTKPQRSASANIPADRNSTSSTTTRSSAWSTSSASSGWSSSTKATSASGASTASHTASASSTPTTKPRASSTSSYPGGIPSSYVTGASPSPSSPLSEAEWRRRQEEQNQKRQEQFRREQERIEAARLSRTNQLSADEVVQLIEHHERVWSRLSDLEELHWSDFPWPMFKRPLSPEDITFGGISAYIKSQYHPDKDSKPLKDRIKDYIRRWHPDRFETKLLSKVVDGDKEKVKEGAGEVVRNLNELLTRTNAPILL